MRRTVLAIAVLAVALVCQLSLLNGLRLPGGGVPDLVLVLVAGLAISGNPVRGMLTGFLAGLALDLAPPGSTVIGEYALVFCLVGWAGGKLHGAVAKSAVLSFAALASVVVIAEILVAGLGKVLDPAQVSVAEIRQVLPSSVAYDLILLPFALVLALLGMRWATRDRLAGQEAASGASAAQSALVHRTARKPRLHEPHLAPSAGRPHDGWVGSRPPGLAERRATQRRPAMPHGLRPANGVAGSAVGIPAVNRLPPPRPVNLHLARRHAPGAVGNPIGTGLGGHQGFHRSARTTASTFRPHAGLPGGSATIQAAALVRPGWRRPVSIRFGARRHDGSVGRLLGVPQTTATVPAPARSGLNGLRMQFRRSAAPKFRSAATVPTLSRRKAEPRFRRAGTPAGPARAAALAASGSIDHQEFLAARRRHAAHAPKLHLASGRRGDGMLGSASYGLHRSLRPPASPKFHVRPVTRRTGRTRAKQPNFRYGRHSVLTFLAGRRIGGRWLAGARVGSRSGVWLIGRRTGGVQ